MYAVVARRTCRSQNVQSTPFSDHFWKLGCGFAWQGQCTLPKVSKTWRFCSIFKNVGRRGTLEEDLQRCISRGRRSARDMFIRDVRRSWSVRSSLQMICVTSAALRMAWPHFFRGRRSTLDRWNGTIAKRVSSLLSTFRFWSKSRRIASFLMLSTWKIEEVSQNCCVFDAVKFKNWGSLAEVLRFWCCQVQTFRKSRRIASYSSLRIDR